MQVFPPELGVSPLKELLSFRMFFSVISDMMCDHSLGKLVEMEASFVVFKFLLVALHSNCIRGKSGALILVL